MAKAKALINSHEYLLSRYLELQLYRLFVLFIYFYFILEWARGGQHRSLFIFAFSEIVFKQSVSKHALFQAKNRKRQLSFIVL